HLRHGPVINLFLLHCRHIAERGASMRARAVPCSVTLVAVSLATALVAQTTASLTGIVTSGGKPLPGVVVTLRSDALQGTRVTMTSDAGTYDFGRCRPA